MPKYSSKTEESVDELEQRRREEESAKMRYQKESTSSMSEDSSGENNAVPFVRQERKVGRNEACPCGSGKKYKVCHGRL